MCKQRIEDGFYLEDEKKLTTYQVPDDPYKNMLSYIYSRKHLKQYYTISRKLPKVLKYFVWGEKDFVAAPEIVS